MVRAGDPFNWQEEYSNALGMTALIYGFPGIREVA